MGSADLGAAEGMGRWIRSVLVLRVKLRLSVVLVVLVGWLRFPPI